MIQILTHRGLDPEKQGYFKESSLEAFRDQLERGFGLEFDIQITKDKKIIIFHDKNLLIGDNLKNINEINSEEIINNNYGGCHITTLANLLLEIKNFNTICALHFKGYLQNRVNADLLLKNLENFDISNLIIFDVKEDIARYIKSINNRIQIAPSVSHEYDIKRFNKYIYGTLITLEEAVKNKELYNWLWFDEWDRKNHNSKSKKLYSEENFKKARATGFRVVVVSPELHSTSPNLLGGENHEDAADANKFKKRAEEIIKLNPDIICTDRPDFLKNLIKLNNK